MKLFHLSQIKGILAPALVLTPIVLSTGDISKLKLGDFSPSLHPINRISTPSLQMARVLSGRTIVTFNRDGKQLITARDRTITFWDLKSAKEVTHIEAHDLPILALTLSPNGQFLASASHDQTVKIWNLQTRQLVKTLTGHRSFSPDGKLLASGGGDRTVRLWNLTTGGMIRSFSQQPDPVYALTFNATGDRLISGGWSVINLWNVTTGSRISQLEGHEFGVNALLLSPDGQQLFSAAGDKTIKIWNLQTGSLRYTLSGHQFGVTSLAVNKEQNLLISSGLDNTIRLWNPQTGAAIATLPTQASVVEAISLSPDMALLASSCWDGKVSLWSLATQKEVLQLKLPNPTPDIY